MRPAPTFALLLAALVLALASIGEENTGKLPTCTPPQITNAAGLLLGYPCTTSADCKYGVCDLQALSTGGAFGICTKLGCTCGVSAPCDLDQIPGQTPAFTCIIPSGGTAHCVPKCTSVDQCTAIDPRYNACTNTPPNYAYGTIGVSKFCVVNP